MSDPAKEFLDALKERDRDYELLKEQDPVRWSQAILSRDAAEKAGWPERMAQMGIPPAERVRALNYANRLRDSTWSEEVSNAAREVGRGVVRGVASASLGTSVAADSVSRWTASLLSKTEGDIEPEVEEYWGARLANTLNNWVDKEFPQDPRLADKFRTKIWSGIGSTVPFFAMGVVGGALGKSLGMAGKLAPTLGMGAATGAGSTYEEAIALLEEQVKAGKITQKEAKDRAVSAGRWGGLIGLSEVFGVPARTMRFVDKINDIMGGGLMAYFRTQLANGLGKEAIEEGLQEFFQQTATNVVMRQKLIDETRDFLKGSGEALLLGGTVGAIFGGLTTLAGTPKAAKISMVRDFALSDRGTAAFANQFPEKANELASKESISRTDVEETFAAVLTSAADRKVFGEHLRSYLDASKVRSDQRLPDETRAAEEVSPEEGGPDLQRQQEKGRKARDRETPESVSDVIQRELQTPGYEISDVTDDIQSSDLEDFSKSFPEAGLRVLVTSDPKPARRGVYDQSTDTVFLNLTQREYSQWEEGTKDIRQHIQGVLLHEALAHRGRALHKGTYAARTPAITDVLSVLL